MNLGVLYSLLAYLAWGLLPLYWKMFENLPAGDILSHRMLWSFVFVALVLTMTSRWKELFQTFSNRKTAALVTISSLLISSNWLIFIWAVNNGHVIQTSLGYYINPLLNVVIGVMFLKERLNWGQWLAIGLALIGVMVLTISYGTIPWISLSLAITFGLYGLVKKKLKVDAMVGLAGETSAVLPITLAYLVYSFWGTHTASADSLSFVQWGLIMLSGVATAMPLYWFAQAAKRLPLSTIGFIQYLAPSISLVLGITVFKETFTTVHAVSFSFIWGALIVFTWSSIYQARMQSVKASM